MYCRNNTVVRIDRGSLCNWGFEHSDPLVVMLGSSIIEGEEFTDIPGSIEDNLGYPSSYPCNCLCSVKDRQV